jgi:hypothetical protein
MVLLFFIGWFTSGSERPRIVLQPHPKRYSATERLPDIVLLDAFEFRDRFFSSDAGLDER